MRKPCSLRTTCEPFFDPGSNICPSTPPGDIGYRHLASPGAFLACPDAVGWVHTIHVSCLRDAFEIDDIYPVRVLPRVEGNGPFRRKSGRTRQGSNSTRLDAPLSRRALVAGAGGGGYGFVPHEHRYPGSLSMCLLQQ